MLKASYIWQVGEVCRKAGAKEVDVRTCTLSDGAAVQNFCKGILTDYGHVDVLVLAAGIFEYSGSLEGAYASDY